MEDQVSGSVKDIAGKVQDAVGGAIGDAGLQARGKAKQAQGQLQQSLGDAVDAFRETAISKPLITFAVVAGVGFALGAFWARRD